MTPSAASAFWPTIRRWLPPWRRKRAEVGSLIATGSPSQAWADRGDGGPGRGVEQRRGAAGCAARSAGGVPLEDDRRAGEDRLALAGQVAELLQVGLAALVGEPDDLEEVVPLGRAVGVVVDRLAGPGEQLGGGVLLAEDQVGVGLAALEGDPHGHLAERASGPGRRPRRASASRGGRGRRTPGPAGPGGRAAARPPGRACPPRRRTPGTRRRSAGSGAGGACPGRCGSR